MSSHIPQIHHPSEEQVEQTAQEAAVERTEANKEAAQLLNSAESIPVLQEGSDTNAADSVSPLVLTDDGQELSAHEHYVHDPGHDYVVSDDSQIAATGDETAALKPSLVAEAIDDPALAGQLAFISPALAAQLAARDPAIAAELVIENPGLAAQLAVQNPALAMQLLAQNPGMAMQLASQNPALAAQLAAHNPSLAAQLSAQYPELAQTEDA